MRILIISSSLREKRASHRVALFLERFIQKRGDIEVDILDLRAENYPLFLERYKFLENPSESERHISESISRADAVVMLAPEYNGSFPASLKNIIDFLYEEWREKPIGIVPVSGGPFGGMQGITSLVFILWKLGARVSSTMLPIPFVQDMYDNDGNPKERESAEARATAFVDALFREIR